MARGFARRDSGKLLETVVINEMLRLGWELYYGKTGKGLEVDCIALKVSHDLIQSHPQQHPFIDIPYLFPAPSLPPTKH